MIGVKGRNSKEICKRVNPERRVGYGKENYAKEFFEECSGGWCGTRNRIGRL
jgi:hypothetical protein